MPRNRKPPTPGPRSKRGTPGRRLPGRHLKFARLIVAGQDPTAAALACGYSPRSANQTGWDLLHKPKYAALQELIRTKQAEAWERAVASGIEVLVRLSEVLRDGDNREVVAAAKLLLQYHGLLTERVEVRGQVDVVHHDYSRLTDEQLGQLHALTLLTAQPSSN